MQSNNKSRAAYSSLFSLWRLSSLTCHYKQFNDAGNEPLKNKLDWLAEYINFFALAYHCKGCLEKVVKVSQELDSTIILKAQVAQDINVVKQSIVLRDNKIQALHEVIAQLTSFNRENSAPENSLKQNQPPTYSSIISAGIEKNAVFEAIREQQKVITDKSSIIIYGFPEEGNDNEQLLDKLTFLGSHCDIIQHTWIGSSSYQHNTSSVRPIKIALRSFNDASIILSRAKYLKSDIYYNGVYMNKWLSEEMKSIKQLHHQCDDLNLSHSSSNNGLKQIVVISEKIMQRNANGRLETYDNITKLLKKPLPLPVPNISPVNQLTVLTSSSSTATPPSSVSSTLQNSGTSSSINISQPTCHSP